MSSTSSRVATWASFVKFEHTLFSLPMLYAGAVVATGSFPGPRIALLILVAGAGARTAAMGLNRIIDRNTDARNPRTEVRGLATGPRPAGTERSPGRARHLPEVDSERTVRGRRLLEEPRRVLDRRSAVGRGKDECPLFILLFIHFNNIIEVVIVMASLPFALLGGFWLIYLLGYNMSVAVGVGFIALAGLSTETGIVMLVYLDEVFKRKKEENRMKTAADLNASIVEGAVERVRPLIMTVATTLIGLLPVMYGSGAGSQIMKRIAAPMVGGLISSTIMTLIIIPVFYDIWKTREINSKNKP